MECCSYVVLVGSDYSVDGFIVGLFELPSDAIKLGFRCLCIFDALYDLLLVDVSCFAVELCQPIKEYVM